MDDRRHDRGGARRGGARRGGHDNQLISLPGSADGDVLAIAVAN